MTDELLTAQEVAAILKMSKRYVAEKLAAKPTFPAPIRIPQLRWWKSEIEAWIHKQPQQRRGGG